MNLSTQNTQSKNCLKHNQPILCSSNPNNDQNKDIYCIVCSQNLIDEIPAHSFNQQQQRIKEQAMKLVEINFQLIQSIMNTLLNQKQRIISSIDDMIKFSQEQIMLNKETKLKLNRAANTDSEEQNLTDDLRSTINHQKQLNQSIKNQFKNFWMSLQQYLDNILEIKETGLDATQAKSDYKNLICKTENELQPKKIIYQQMKEFTLKQNNKCYAFAFNNNNTILAVACQKEIIMHEFEKGFSKVISRLNNHSSLVYCLFFMKHKNILVSGSYDKSIIIWILNQQNRWIVQQVLKEHAGPVTCLLSNRDEGLIISGSKEKELKFWRRSTGDWNCRQTIKTQYAVDDVSLNEAEDKLITCQNNSNPTIQVLIQNRQEWLIIQTLDFPGQYEGYRICFTIQDQFTFSTLNCNYLEIYDYNQGKKEFILVSQQQMQQVDTESFLFPCQYIKLQNIFTFKHGQFLNIFKVNENYYYELIQTIKFGDHELYGTISDNGQYIVTWDYSSKEIQIREMKFLE